MRTGFLIAHAIFIGLVLMDSSSSLHLNPSAFILACVVNGFILSLYGHACRKEGYDEGYKTLRRESIKKL